MKKTLSSILAVLLMLCMVPTFCVFAAEDEFATIDSPEEFAAFTKALNDGSYAPSDSPTITVTTDLDMRNITDFQPINNLNLVDLDFQGHTIYNLVVTMSGDGGKAGILANIVTNHAIYDVSFYNCMLTANGFERVGFAVGSLDRGGITGVNVENCTVKAELTPNESMVNKLVSAVVGGYDYDVFEMEANVKNVVLESSNAVAFCSVIGSIYNAEIVITNATIENVTAIKGGQTSPVDNLLGLSSADRTYLKDLITYDDCVISISNTATATGYSGTPVNQEQLPEKPVETPVTTTATTTTAKTPTTTVPTTTVPTTTVAGDDEKGGCKGFAGASVAIISLVTAAGCALLLKKKED